MCLGRNDIGVRLEHKVLETKDLMRAQWLPPPPTTTDAGAAASSSSVGASDAYLARRHARMEPQNSRPAKPHTHVPGFDIISGRPRVNPHYSPYEHYTDAGLFLFVRLLLVLVPFSLNQSFP